MMARLPILNLAKVLLLAVFLLTPAVHVIAQTGDNPLRLTTSPVPIRLETLPGGTVSTSLRIKNDGASPETLSVSVMKFSANDTTGRPKLEDPLPTDTFVNWVTFSEKEFTVTPNEWKTITATFTVPADAAFGYYYAIVFSRSTPQQVAADQTPVIGGTAVLVLLEARVAGAVREVAVADFSTNRPWYEFLPVVFQAKLQNKGNVHVAPRGNIFITRGRGPDIAILEVNPQQGSILPSSGREFKSQWKDSFPVYESKVGEDGGILLTDTGEAAQKLTWDYSNADKLRWGRYTATMLLVYDNGQRDVPIESTVSFWVLPWRLAIGALVGLIFILIGLWSTIKRIFSRIFRRRG